MKRTRAGLLLDLFVDGLVAYQPTARWPFTQACHLFTCPGNLAELHAFAAQLGLRRAWFQNKRTLPHYDLNAAKRALAVRLGAQSVGREVLVNIMEDWRLGRRLCGWQCAVCGWTARTGDDSPTGIDSACIRDPNDDKHLMLVCPECLTPGRFVDAYEPVPEPFRER